MDSSAIQRQIELLQAQLIPMKAQALKRVETLEETVERVLQKKLAEISSQVEPVAEEGNKMLSAIGSALTEDQQQWLSLPENQNSIPDFFNTDEGKAITKRFIMAYKEYKQK
jgi:hypothetical protein